MQQLLFLLVSIPINIFRFLGAIFNAFALLLEGFRVAAIELHVMDMTDLYRLNLENSLQAPSQEEPPANGPPH